MTRKSEEGVEVNQKLFYLDAHVVQAASLSHAGNVSADVQRGFSGGWKRARSPSLNSQAEENLPTHFITMRIWLRLRLHPGPQREAPPP